MSFVTIEMLPVRPEQGELFAPCRLTQARFAPLGQAVKPVVEIAAGRSCPEQI